MPSYRVISSDSHVLEPPELWTSRIDPKYRDRAPQLVRLEDGDWWMCEGAKVMLGPPNATMAGRRFESEMKMDQEDRFGQGLPGGYIPEAHVKDLDTDGVYGDVIYPSIGLGLYRFNPGTDLLNAIFSAYNDWLADFCSAYPSRLKGIAMINLEDIPAGIKELERCAKMGLAGAMISTYPDGTRYNDGRAYDSLDYEPLWGTAQDLNMPLSLHRSTNRPARGEQFMTGFGSYAPMNANSDHWVRMSLSQIIFSGVLERYPKLQLGSVEDELSWVPHFIDRLDYTYTQRTQGENSHRFQEDMLPSDYFHRNVFLSFQEDGLGIRLRDIIGVDQLMWGSDYPHPEGTFPRSREILEEILSDCTEEEKAKIAGGNVARVFGFD